MRISTVENAMPESPPPLPEEKREQYVWGDLAYRLIHPTRLAIMEALARLERPLAPADLAPMVDVHKELARYHCRALVRAGVLEVVDVRLRPDPRGEESAFYFSSPRSSTPRFPAARR